MLVRREKEVDESVRFTHNHYSNKSTEKLQFFEQRLGVFSDESRDMA